jgi:hypothetical protein
VPARVCHVPIVGFGSGRGAADGHPPDLLLTSHGCFCLCPTDVPPFQFKALRPHPSSLIFWRSLSDVVFSLQFIILFSLKDGSDHCNIFSFLFQFSVLASQSWYFMNAGQ